MPSTADSGHAKNVANFESEISFCIGYGAKYNPANKLLSIANIKSQYVSAQSVFALVKKTQTYFKSATNNRMDAFAPLKGLATQVVNALDATEASVQTVKNAKTILKKIRGQRATLIATPEPGKEGEQMPTAKTNSVSQQSFDLMIDHWEKLVALLEAEPLYSPNEKALTTGALAALIILLKATNTAVLNTNTTWNNARISRTEIMYNPSTGIVAIALDIKKYVLSIYGAASAEYKQVKSLPFKNIVD